MTCPCGLTAVVTDPNPWCMDHSDWRWARWRRIRFYEGLCWAFDPTSGHRGQCSSVMAEVK